MKAYFIKVSGTDEKGNFRKEVIQLFNLWNAKMIYMNIKKLQTLKLQTTIEGVKCSINNVAIYRGETLKW